MRNEFVVHTMTDPETGNSYRFEARFHDKDVEVEVFRGEVCQANIMIEVYAGRGQVIVADSQKMAETGGDDPQFVKLFEEQSLPPLI